MASRNYFPGSRRANPETVMIEGSFTGNGGSSPAAANNTGRHWTVARTGAGVYTITFADKFPHFIKGNVSLQLGTPAGWVAVLGAYTAASKTLVVAVFDNTAVPAAADLTSSDRCHFSATFQNSGLPVK
jgi:predicted nicotinamide N-methyase